MKEQQDDNVEQLWEQYFADRSDAAKNLLLTHYIYLVVGVVKRMMPQYQEYCDKDDLISSGILGLIDAVEKYDRSFNTKFQTYAAIRIRGEVIDYLRKQDWAPTGLRRKITSIQKTSETLETSLHRTPTDKEIADSLGMVDMLTLYRKYEACQKAVTTNDQTLDLAANKLGRLGG